MSATAHRALARRFQQARGDERLAILEGFHALKHALRFGAEVEVVAAADPEALERMADELAPDLAGRFRALAGEPVAAELLRTFVPHVPYTQALAIARRPPFDAAALRAARGAGPIVLLEDPRDLGNIGAVVRVAAGADAAGVVTTGMHDPWDPAVLRGSAGLHFALPVGRDDGFAAALAGEGAAPAPRRPLLALDPDGELLDPARCPPTPCSPSGPSATASASSCSRAPTRACGCRCAPASPASTSRRRSRRCCSRGGSAPATRSRLRSRERQRHLERLAAEHDLHARP